MSSCSRRRPLLRPRGLVAALAATGAGLALALSATPSSGAVEPNRAPLTADDTLTIYGKPVNGGYSYTSQALVLRNDSDPDGDVLTICEVQNPDPDVLAVTIGRARTGEPTVEVSTTVNAPFTYEITYRACDGQLSTPGTLTVEVKQVGPLQAVAQKKGGRVRFTNPGDVPLDVSFDGGSFNLNPNVSRIVHVISSDISYTAFSDMGADGGAGIVSDLTIPSKRVDPIEVTRLRRPGWLQLVNTGPDKLEVRFGAPGFTDETTDGRVTLASGATAKIRTGRQRLAFAAYDPDSFLADEGSVTGLNQR